MKTRNRAQVSMEFLIFIGIAFIIAISFSVFAIDKIRDARIQNEADSSKDLAMKLQRELLIAGYVEDGYTRRFDIPDKIENTNYSISMQNSTLTIKSQNSLYIVAIPKTLGNFTKGTNTVNKTGGVIYVN